MSGSNVGSDGQTVAVGLLGFIGTALPDNRIAMAVARAPWRGEPTAVRCMISGGIVGLGSARLVGDRNTTIGVHGRIDNLADVADRLTMTECDEASVLIRAYRGYGDDFARQLVGDFALLVLDESRNTLLGTRDWIGTRPLFWAEHDGMVAFGSEVKQVLALLGLPHITDEDTLRAYQNDGVPTLDATFARGVRAVRPNGQVLAMSGGTARAWASPIRFEPIHARPAEATVRTRQLLANAVRRRTQGSRGVASLVSGGMDSTSVASMAAYLERAEGGPRMVAGLTMTFPTVPSSDESMYARAVAEHAGIPWVPVPILPETLRETISDHIALHDGPTFPSIGTDFAAARATALGADTLLSGQLADCWLNQVDVELELAMLRDEWMTVLRYFSLRLRHAPKWAVRSLLRAGRWHRQRRRAEAHFEIGDEGYWIRVALEVEERRAMRHGVQVEFPFADEELARYLAGLPVGVRSLGLQSKGVLRAAMRGLMPDLVLDRSGKTTFDAVHEATFGASAGTEASALDEALRCYTEAYLSSQGARGPALTQ